MSRPKVYKCNESYFSSITKPNQAYILGFLWADAHINTRSGIRIIIKKSDRSVLQFIKKELKSNCPIKDRHYVGHDYVDLSINRLSMVKDLFALGLTSNKSGTNCPIPNIAPKLIPYFLRGVFDGDGSIWRKGKNCWALSYTGGRPFLSWIDLQFKKYDIRCSPIRRRYKGNDHSCMMDITHKDNILKVKLLFLNRGFMLSRKQKRLQQAYSFTP